MDVSLVGVLRHACSPPSVSLPTPYPPTHTAPPSLPYPSPLTNTEPYGLVGIGFLYLYGQRNVLMDVVFGNGNKH